MSERITPEQYKTLAAKEAAKGKGKYGNKFVQTEEGLFHSRGEYRRWTHLQRAQRYGQISDLKRQQVFEIVINGIAITGYTADFTYQNSGRFVVEDFKGAITKEFEIKYRLMLAVYGVKVYLTTDMSADLG